MRSLLKDSRPRSRGRLRRTLPSFAVTVGCMFALTGCFLQSLVGFVGDGGGTSLSGNVEATFCSFDSPIPAFYGCTYTIRDDNGFLIEVTSTFQLITELGIIGVIVDPLILQVPDDAANVVATYNNAGSDDPLVVTETTSFSVTPAITVDSEPGTKFLILELPDAVLAALPPGPNDFNFSLDFDVNDPANLSVKPLLTASIDEAGTRYYVPIFPCVTDFSLIPDVPIPLSATFEFLNPALGTLVTNGAQFACDQVTYDFTAVAVPTCGSKPVTIDMNTNGGNGMGTAGPDVVLGTPSNDTITTLGGIDTVCAGDGNDLIRGGAGADILRGGPGADTIYGQGGGDDILGGPGADTIYGEAGGDNIMGGSGPDTIDGGTQSDVLRGQGGIDTIIGGAGPDVIDGLGGADILSGGDGADSLTGQNGADQITAGSGSDTVAGGTGADVIFGESGDDTLFGGNGNDTLYGGAGFDKCAGNFGVNDQADHATCEQTPGVETLF